MNTEFFAFMDGFIVMFHVKHFESKIGALRALRALGALRALRALWALEALVSLGFISLEAAREGH